jgi:hypothetical protein
MNFIDKIIDAMSEHEAKEGRAPVSLIVGTEIAEKIKAQCEYGSQLAGRWYFNGARLYTSKIIEPNEWYLVAIGQTEI